MVSGSTGLAPLRALIVELGWLAVNPQVHLFVGKHYRYRFYDLRTL